MVDLTGKTALVTGGTSGIGKATALAGRVRRSNVPVRSLGTSISIGPISVIVVASGNRVK
jgi:hypothetical protein